MLKTNEKKYEVWSVSGRDEYGQVNAPMDTGRRIVANVVEKQQVIVENQIEYVYSTHFGLTSDKTLVVGQQLREGDKKYTIKQVNNSGRLTQLVLEG